MLVVIRGAGDLASGIALRLYRAGARIVMLDEVPTAASLRCIFRGHSPGRSSGRA